MLLLINRLHYRNNIFNGRGMSATWRTDGYKFLGEDECKFKQPSSLYQSSKGGHSNAENYGSRCKKFLLITYKFYNY